MADWWETFFDAEYLRVWGGFMTPAITEEQAAGIWELLELREGSKVLDAPCGYGRLSRALAQRGAVVLGVDQSPALLEQAEKDRGDVPPERLRYLRHDLRQPLAEMGFDAAINIFTSLGYGTEEDDVAILTTLQRAVRAGGVVFIETNHRDTAAAFYSRVPRPASRLPDGTLLVEEHSFDAITGRAELRWSWWGPHGQGEKSASLRLYTVTELVNLLARAGLRFRSAHHGCSKEPFKAEGAEMGGRLGLLAEREAG